MSGSPFLNPAQLENMEVPEQIVEDIIPSESTGMIYGPPGSYKSFKALDIGLHVASGEPWLGHRTKQGDALFIVTEGVASLRNRYLAWKKMHPGHDLWDNVQLMADEISPDGSCQQARWTAHFHRAPVQFGDPYVAQQFLNDLLEFEVYPRIVVIDTLSKCARGLDENNVSEMGRFMEGLQVIKEYFSCAIVLIHHSNRQGQYRGSSLLHGEVDFMIEMKAADNRITATCMKQRDLELFAPINFEPEIVELEPGKGLHPPVSSVVLKATNPKTSFNADLAWRVLASRPFGATAKEWEHAVKEQGGSRTSFYRARESLLENTLVHKDSDRYYANITNSFRGTDIPSVSPKEEWDQVGLNSDLPIQTAKMGGAKWRD